MFALRRRGDADLRTVASSHGRGRNGEVIDATAAFRPLLEGAITKFFEKPPPHLVVACSISGTHSST